MHHYPRWLVASGHKARKRKLVDKKPHDITGAQVYLAPDCRDEFPANRLARLGVVRTDCHGWPISFARKGDDVRENM